MSDEIDYKSCTSETAKYRRITSPYCRGSGIDIGSGGDPVVPNAMSMDLPSGEYLHYHSQQTPEHAIHLQGDAHRLDWFRDGVLDFVYSSHLIEDFVDWDPLLKEWMRVLKPGGHLVILLPDKKLWNAAIARGQPPNCAHKHESYPGELSEHFMRLGGVKVMVDELTGLFEGDYSILFVAKKL